MKIVIAGGTGQVGVALSRHFLNLNQEVIILSRRPSSTSDPRLKMVIWDGSTLGDWVTELEGATAVINLAGRTVNCRYTQKNLTQMMTSRVDSTRVIGEAIEQSVNPPSVWLQMSTATIYAHRYDASNDEESGWIGGDEADVPDYWSYSVEIAKAWEETQSTAHTPQTRKVALRTAMVMTPDLGGIFDVLYRMTRGWLGGSIGGGQQFVSWIHERDFIQAIEVLIQDQTITGPINLCSPHPLPQAEFMSILRQSMGVKIGLPATRWMAEVGAFFLRTDTELLLKSRRVIPQRLLNSGFHFQFPEWTTASKDLVQHRRGH